jgi:hypothetical protein
MNHSRCSYFRNHERRIHVTTHALPAP